MMCSQAAQPWPDSQGYKGNREALLTCPNLSREGWTFIPPSHQSVAGRSGWEQWYNLAVSLDNNAPLVSQGQDSSGLGYKPLAAALTAAKGRAGQPVKGTR